MFRDRAIQFKQRLGWDVTVDNNGFERDEYDDLNPLYAIWVLPNGMHGGSMRTLPTTGRVMVNDYFSDVIGHKIQSETCWESTRFCMAPDLGNSAVRISAAIMLAGCQIGLSQGLDTAVAVFDPRMVRIYRQLGWSPNVLGLIGEGRQRICAGTWTFSREIQANMARQAGVTVPLSELWYLRSMGHQNANAA
jgi:acyl homoserine lactone synthase